MRPFLVDAATPNGLLQSSARWSEPWSEQKNWLTCCVKPWSICIIYKIYHPKQKVPFLPFIRLKVHFFFCNEMNLAYLLSPSFYMHLVYYLFWGLATQ